MVLGKEKTNRSTEQSREPINIVNLSLTRSKSSAMEQRSLFKNKRTNKQKMVLEELDSSIQRKKNESRHRPVSSPKLTQNGDLNVKCKTTKLIVGKKKHT